jgi:hypothetical protein
MVGRVAPRAPWIEECAAKSALVQEGMVLERVRAGRDAGAPRRARIGAPYPVARSLETTNEATNKLAFA